MNQRFELKRAGVLLTPPLGGEQVIYRNENADSSLVLLLIVRCQLPIAHCLLPIAHCPYHPLVNTSAK
jgi:hypothetical protein